jgi:hypothetical protein
VLKFSDLSISSMLCAVALSSSIKSTRIVGPQPRRPHQRADTSQPSPATGLWTGAPSLLTWNAMD